MRDKSDRYRVQTVPTFSQPKRIGTYLVEAGLITTDQVAVALNDQQATGMKFGEVLVARGWLKEQTVEWVMSKVVMPERKVQQRSQQNAQNLQQVPPPQVPQRAPQPRQPQVPQSQRPIVTPPIAQPAASSQPIAPAASGNGMSNNNPNSVTRREAPITKPLPPVNSSDDAVNWVG